MLWSMFVIASVVEPAVGKPGKNEGAC